MYSFYPAPHFPYTGKTLWLCPKSHKKISITAAFLLYMPISPHNWQSCRHLIALSYKKGSACESYAADPWCTFISLTNPYSWSYPWSEGSWTVIRKARQIPSEGMSLWAFHPRQAHRRCQPSILPYVRYPQPFLTSEGLLHGVNHKYYPVSDSACRLQETEIARNIQYKTQIAIKRLKAPIQIAEKRNILSDSASSMACNDCMDMKCRTGGKAMHKANKTKGSWEKATVPRTSIGRTWERLQNRLNI